MSQEKEQPKKPQQPNMAEIMSDPAKANAFFAQMPEEFWLQKGSMSALENYKKTIDLVPGYKKFLKKNKLEKIINDVSEFEKIPIMSKESYLNEYDINEVSVGGDITSMYWISSSSGFSGKARYWPRTAEQDIFTPSLVELIYTLQGVTKGKTLIINCLALGTWIAGNFMTLASLEIAKRSENKITVITPGARNHEIINIIKDLHKFYDQILLIGYPPTLRNVINMGEENNINWKEMKVLFFLGGEPISVGWKKYINSKTGSKSVTDILPVYGMSEVGVLSFETPIASIMRDILEDDKELSNEIFGAPVSALMQYNPMSRWIEQVNGELILTAFSGIPLIRYNTHDLGGVLKFSEVVDKFKMAGYDLFDLVKEHGLTDTIWRWPFFYSFGRGGGSISLMGANIYPRDIEEFINEQSKVNDFKLSVEHNEQQLPKLLVHLELNEKVIMKKKDISSFISKMQTSLLKTLRENNSDFADGYLEEPEIMTPAIAVYDYNEGPFNHEKIKQSHVLK